MIVATVRRSILCAIGAGPMLTWRLRPCGRCISLSHLQRFRSSDAGDPTRVPSVYDAYRSSDCSLPALNVPILNTMGRQSSLRRRWTEAEDAAIRLSARRGWPTLRELAGGSGRTYVAIRHRASRLGATRLHRLDPSQRAALGPSEIPCRYCGSMFLASGGTRYCGGECRTLAVGQCPGCGRAVGKALRCSHCAVDGKRADWPERATV